MLQRARQNLIGQCKGDAFTLMQIVRLVSRHPPLLSPAPTIISRPGHPSGPPNTVLTGCSALFLPPKAGARHERRLATVGSSPMFGAVSGRGLWGATRSPPVFPHRRALHQPT